jgi:hypothetical protein
MQLAVGGCLVPFLKKYTDEYPPYASYVPLPRAMRAEAAAADRNPSVYSDRTWAVLTQAKAAVQTSESDKSSQGNDAAATSAESEKAARRFVRNIKIRTALIMAAMFLLNRRDAARVVGL